MERGSLMVVTAGAAFANLMQRIDRAATRAGTDHVGSIPPEMTFIQWCEALGRAGLRVDRKPFSLADRPALVPVYHAIPTTAAEAQDEILVLMKATQLGLTVAEVLADVYFALKFGPVNIGLFLPDQATASFKSEHRFMPILRSAPMLYRALTHRTEDNGEETRIGEGNVMTRVLGSSLLLFLWTSGKVSTESRPMDIVSLDEVQEMSLSEIHKVMARTGDSLIRYKMLLSTANMPDADIHHWFLRGTQEAWHTECPTCGELSDLSDPAGIFPAKSIAYSSGDVPRATGGPEVPTDDYVWTCPACRHHVPDPQVGRYVQQNPTPELKVRSFLLPRTISPRETPRKMITEYNHAKTGDQRKSFYNRTLARPYIDADQLPVTLAHCQACVDEGRRAGVTWQDAGRDCVMGVDQMGSWCAVIIKRRLPDGRQAVVHVAALFGDDAIDQCDELMHRYGVTCCVIEQLPNVNDARRFANRFPRRVFLAGYADLRDDMLLWSDDLTKSDRRTSEEDRTRWTVTINQFKAMQLSLCRVRDKLCLFPDPDLLEADVVDDGEPRRIMLLRDWTFHHFTKTALVVQQKDDERKPRARVLKVGIDPHYSFANMLCDVAWARAHGTGTMFFPGQMEIGAISSDNSKPGKPTLPSHGERADRQVAAMEKLMPGLPKSVLDLVADVPLGVCGGCSSFLPGPEGSVFGRCDYRGMNVRPRDVECDFYVRRHDELRQT